MILSRCSRWNSCRTGSQSMRSMIPKKRSRHVEENPASVDVAVVDYNIPGMNGAEVLRALHDLQPNLPVVMVSGMPPVLPGITPKTLVSARCENRCVWVSFGSADKTDARHVMRGKGGCAGTSAGLIPTLYVIITLKPAVECGYACGKKRPEGHKGFAGTHPTEMRLMSLWPASPLISNNPESNGFSRD